MGISIGENNTAYVNKLAQNQKSVSGHERTHQYFKEGDYTDFDTDFLRSPYNTDFKGLTVEEILI